jgi:FxsC-like protein
MESAGQEARDTAHQVGEGPYFFLSYAHTPADPDGPDPDHWVHVLFKDLCRDILQLTTLPGPAHAGFMDRQLRAGDGWPDKLSENLAACRVFVPLYAPRYFSSMECGREWYAFNERVLRARRTGQGDFSAIVPALWTPVPLEELPEPARHIHVDHTEYGTEYARDGFYGLIKVKRLHDAYEEAVFRLARRIVDVARTSSPPPSEPTDYEATPSAFKPHGTSARSIHLTVAAPTRYTLPEHRTPEPYGTTAQDWGPYQSETTRSLIKVAGEQIRSLDYQLTVSDFDEPAVADAAGRAPAGADRPHVFLLDPWALSDDGRRQRLAAYDAAAQPWTSMVVPRCHGDAQNRDEDGEQLFRRVADTLPTLTERGRLSGCRTAVDGVPTLDAFSQVLPKVVAETANRFFTHAKAHPPAGERLTRPRLVGPQQRDQGAATQPPLAPGGSA